MKEYTIGLEFEKESSCIILIRRIHPDLFEVCNSETVFHGKFSRESPMTSHLPKNTNVNTLAISVTHGKFPFPILCNHDLGFMTYHFLRLFNGLSDGFVEELLRIGGLRIEEQA